MPKLPFFCVLLLCMLAACAKQPGPNYPERPLGEAPHGSVSALQVEQLPATARSEWEDRVARIERLANEMGVSVKPELEHFQVEPGTIPGYDFPIPVTMIRFSGKAFFAFDDDTPIKTSTELVKLVAETIKRDMPDTHLLLLGHTDSMGAREYNQDLSQRRALNVMRELKSMGVRAGQMSTVAVGEMQPLVSNKTGEGRGKNRRVEFLISASETANLHTVAEADFCETCIDDHGQDRVVSDNSRDAVQDLEVVSLSDDVGQSEVGGTLETAKKKTVRSYLEEHKTVDVY
ncbi:MAG: OmpA family protein [Proteobacteria bacterium]|nr:OmpA family protein [Pseudomonadota bacterium]